MDKPVFTTAHIRLAALDPEKDPAVEAPWTYDLDYARARRPDPLRPVHAAELKTLYQEQEKDLDEKFRSLTFGVRLLEDDRLIGFARFERIWWPNSDCAVVFAIGDEQARGLYEPEVLDRLLVYAFDELNLFRLTVDAGSDQPDLIEVLERAGLRLEIRQRERLFRAGRYEDKLTYAITVDEWRGRSQERMQ